MLKLNIAKEEEEELRSPEEVGVNRVYGRKISLEHIHLWAERQTLEKAFEGLQACNNFF